MKIKEGKRYWTRDGRRTAMVRSSTSRSYPFLVKLTDGTIYLVTEGGCEFSCGESDVDLVAKAVKLKLGERYVTGRGAITAPLIVNPSGLCIKTHPFRCEETGGSFTEFGVSSAAGVRTSFDIIKKYKGD